MLTLVSAESDYIIREDSETYEEFVTTLLPVAVPLVMWDELDLSDAWFAAVRHHQENPPEVYRYRPDRDVFVANLTREVADCENVSVVWCENCDEPVKGDEAESVQGGYACSSCYAEDYRSCDDCGNTVHYESTTYTLSDESICQRCSDNNYSYCEECDGYYHYDYADDHSHGSCDCDVPTLHLCMRNGEGTLSEDDRITVTLPAGVISEEGMNQISRMIRDHAHGIDLMPDPDTGLYSQDALDLRSKWWSLSGDVLGMDAQWQTKEGNFTKRLSKLAHKNHGLKFPPELLTKVGNVGRDQSNGAEVSLELTRNLNLSAEDFYHEDSCWWQSYGDSRCALKTNGGFAMRTFEESQGYGGRTFDRIMGRAFVMPLREVDGDLVPTFDAAGADAYVVFNGYGDLSGYTPARIVADMAGMTYRKVRFDCSPMYVNSSSGYLVTTEEIAARRTSVNLYVDTHSMLHYREESARQLATV